MHQFYPYSLQWMAALVKLMLQIKTKIGLNHELLSPAKCSGILQNLNSLKAKTLLTKRIIQDAILFLFFYSDVNGKLLKN